MSNQERFKLCLLEMKKILEAKNILFFLICGTFLGQYRDNKFIDDDDDIDLGIFHHDLPFNLKEYILSFNNFVLLEEYGNLSSCYKLKFKYTNGIKIDIFIHYQYEINKYYYATFLGIKNNKPIRLNENNFMKWNNTIVGLKKIKFGNHFFMVPKNSEEYLIESYGQDFKTKKKYSYLEGLKNKEFKNIIF